MIIKVPVDTEYWTYMGRCIGWDALWFVHKAIKSMAGGSYHSAELKVIHYTRFYDWLIFEVEIADPAKADCQPVPARGIPTPYLAVAAP